MDRIPKIPKIELHCHLDGSVDAALLRELDPLAAADLEQRITAPDPCHSLGQYLTCFDEILPFLQTEQALIAAAENVIAQAVRENVRYMEVRFAPGFHGTRGLSQTQACRAVLKGLEQGEVRYGVKSRAILCMMRGAAEEANRETLNCAGEMQADGVGGIDLAGNEAAYPPGVYRSLFTSAAERDIPFTIHAGECGEGENVRTAVLMGARRVGHGIAIAGNRELEEFCKRRDICLEMCPISNLQTKAAASAADYPFAELYRKGIPVSVNTDNRTVSNTTLTREWQLLQRHFPQVDEEMIVQVNRKAIDYAFLPDAEKQKLRQEFERS